MGFDAGYALFELGDLVLASRLIGDHRQAELEAAVEWLDSFPTTAPFFFFSEEHPQSNYHISRAWSRLMATGAVDQTFMDQFYAQMRYFANTPATTSDADELVGVTTSGAPPEGANGYIAFPVQTLVDFKFSALGLDEQQWGVPLDQGSLPLFFSAQPAVQSLNGDGGVIAYGTADGGAEDVVSEATVSATVLDTQVFREAVLAIGTAGVSAQDATMMLEGVFATAQAAATVSDTAQRIDAVLTAIAAGASVANAVQLVEAMISSAEAQVSVVDQVLSGVADHVVSVAAAADSASDVQLMVDNVTVMAQAGAGLSEIAGYLEQVVSAATAETSVSDVLRSAFEGGYLFTDLCRPRSFMDWCSPRGRA